MTSILIYAPDIWDGDAVGDHCINLRKVLEDSNYKCNLYAQRGSKNVYPAEYFFRDLTSSDIIFLSYSIFDPNLELIAAFPNKKICYFHGVTPFDLLLNYDPVTSDLCKKSVKQFHILEKFDLILSNSKNSSIILEDVFNDRKKVLSIPPIVKSKFYSNKILENKISDKKSFNLVSVGRIVPHKKIENTLYILSELIKMGVNAKLNIIGKFDENLYTIFLKSLIKDLGLTNNVEFLGFLSKDKKTSAIMNSDVLISCSLHEGFGIPILEAMCLGVPFISSKGAISDEIVENIPTSFSSIKEAVDILYDLFLDKDKIQALKKLGHQRADHLLLLADDAIYINLFNSFFES
jgi:glycosyltransferase involved in cell wall biosynthesis